jgi:hypothetical protein
LTFYSSQSFGNFSSRINVVEIYRKFLSTIYEIIRGQLAIKAAGAALSSSRPIKQEKNRSLLWPPSPSNRSIFTTLPPTPPPSPPPHPLAAATAAGEDGRDALPGRRRRARAYRRRSGGPPRQGQDGARVRPQHPPPSPPIFAAIRSSRGPESARFRAYCLVSPRMSSGSFAAAISVLRLVRRAPSLSRWSS